MGSSLLGVHVGDALTYVTPPLRVDAGFLESVQASGGDAEGRFRFTETCVRDSCAQWTQGECGLIGALLESDLPRLEGSLPECGIRTRCRWHAQRGEVACRVCPYVTREDAPSLAPLTFVPASLLRTSR